IAVSSEALEAAGTTHVPGSLRGGWNPKIVVFGFIAGLVAAAAVFNGQQRRIRQLQSERQQLLIDRKKAGAESEMKLSSTAQERGTELTRLRRSNDGWLRLRREVAQLRQGTEPAPQPTPTTEAPTPPNVPADPHEPGEYISGEQVGFVGFTTPAAAMESVV